MDCKDCANYVPKRKSPFDGLKTADLQLGMLVRRHHLRYEPRGFLVIAAKPGDEKVDVTVIHKGRKPCKDILYLADVGCQPYAKGSWNQSNWLQEVK